MSARRRRPKLAVWKLASCDGCQLTLLDCEDALLEIAERLDIAYFLEASSRVAPGPFDLSLVEGSVSAPEHLEQIAEIRRSSRFLVTIGACATSGGIQALRNFGDAEQFLSIVYAKPEYIRSLATSTPVAAHVPVDFELQGCPIDKRQLLEVVSAFLHGRQPSVPAHSVCVECKSRGTVCVMVTGTPCLGPVTHAGCGALCPAYRRGCYGCFGPMEAPNPESLARALRASHVSEASLLRVFRTFQAARPPFARTSVAAEQNVGSGARGPVEPRLEASLARVEDRRG